MRRQPPQIGRELMEPLARAAHAIWCECLLRDGWQLGDDYDPTMKIEPALRPFDQLPAFERDHLLDDGVWRDVIDTACRGVEFALQFASSELRATDIAVGTCVRLTPGSEPASESDVWTGHVVELKLSDAMSGRLFSIGVKWQDGTIEQNLPHELVVVGV